MSQLRQQETEIESIGIRVLVVTFQAGFMVDSYVRETNLQWPILIDDKLTLYRAYGMEQGSWWNIWGPGSWWIYFKLLIRGRKLRSPKGDVHQLGGDILIDPQGKVRMHHVGSGPADRPSVESILDVVR